jgi:hypothetical protein
MKTIRILTEAVQNLLPNVPIHIDGTGYDNIHTLDGTPLPSEDDVIVEFERVKQYYQNIEYQRQRVPEYPSIGDQLDALFHAGVFPPEMAEQIQAIKDKYPKPE